MKTIATYYPDFAKKYLPVLLAGMLVSFAILKGEMLLPTLLIVVAVALLSLVAMAKNLTWGFYLLMFAAFFSTGAARYEPNLPLGLLIDFILVIMFILFFMKEFKGLQWGMLKTPVFFAVGFWMVINCMEIVNPESRSFEAWFYAMRGVSLYLFLTIMIGLLYLRHSKDFNWFINIWFVCSILGTLWGIKQLYIGLDEAEKAWLEIPGNLSTHMLFGRLRVFSFYSDAGQFGASQAHTALVAFILSINEKKTARRVFYWVTAFFAFYGMLISGTRGAFAIPVVGFFAYFFLIRNWKIIITGTVIFGTFLGILKFTFIGQGIYQINRLRTAMNPNDASLMVRVENQKRLANYLDHHILGGGIGSAGYWGQRFSPNTFLANLALDSWYVRIAAEFGYVGLVLYLMVLLIIVVSSIKTIAQTVDPEARNQLIALFCGLAGILVASYGNQVFGQMPTAIMIYVSIVFLAKPENRNVPPAKP
ncbi:MAG TPA: O-antigen ligase family protein [Chitinophagales bacterium]|nr:O-antigen ligase family protein [Chitinophagales bacterium]